MAANWKRCVCGWQLSGGPPADRQARCDICVFRVSTDDDDVSQERLMNMEGA